MEPRPYSLTCLYTSAPPQLDFDAIATAIASDQHLSHFSPHIVTRLPSKLVSFDFNGQFTVQILTDNLPLDRQVFAIALLGTKATTVKNNFAQIVDTHRGFITVTATPEDQLNEHLEQRLIRLYALQMVTELLYKFAKPDLLYSSMAESLVRPSLNPRSYKGLLDSRIFEQAVLFTRRSHVIAGQSLGANIWGAEELIGKPVIFKQVDFPSWAITQGSTLFFAYCDANGIPEEDCEFTDDNNFEAYDVTLTDPTPNHPNGTIEITITKNYRAEELRPDGSPMFPELLDPTNDPLKPPKESKPTRKSDRSKLHSFMILVIALTFTVVMVTFAAYWRGTGNG